MSSSLPSLQFVSYTIENLVLHNFYNSLEYYIYSFTQQSVSLCCWGSLSVIRHVSASVSAVTSAATVNESCCHCAGAAGFPGGTPAGMPGLGEFLKDPEILNAMKVTYCSMLDQFYCC